MALNQVPSDKTDCGSPRLLLILCLRQSLSDSWSNKTWDKYDKWWIYEEQWVVTMSLIVTYLHISHRFKLYNSTASARNDPMCGARDGRDVMWDWERWRGSDTLILSALSARADLFFKLLTPLCQARPAIISGLSLDFQILQTDLRTWGSEGSN